MTPQIRRGRLVAALALSLLPALACAFAPDAGSNGGLTDANVIWNCPTASPVPPPTPIPTVCATGTPDATGTPGPGACDKPAPTATPLPSATPYGRWLSPGDRGSAASFYEGQDVRVGPLKLRLESYHASGVIPNSGGHLAHIFVLATQNEGSEAIDVQWPLQTLVREIEAGGVTTTGLWMESSLSERQAGIPRWDPARGAYQPGEARAVTVAVEGPPGAAHALGFLPDPVGGQARAGLGDAARLVWFLPQSDPHCAGNTSGPPRQGDGGAVYPRPLPSPPPGQYGYFSGWPVLRNGETVLTQGFGCTAFHEISGYACPNDRPWFHSGIDLADPGRPLVYSALRGRVIYVGVSAGHACTFAGSEAPHTNLGWEIALQVEDAMGRVGPYTVKYGHTQVGSELVGVGDHVVPGQALGRMGSTGCSTGVHLHFMVQDAAGAFLDPFNFLGAPRGGATP